MKVHSKSGRLISAFTAIVFLITSFLAIGVSADVNIADTSTTSVAPGGSVTINVANAAGTEQTTVLVYLGTPEDENILYIDQKAASEGTASFTFKVPTTASAGEYTVLAGSESTVNAGSGKLVVTSSGTDPVVLESIAVSNQKTEYTVGDEFVKPTVTATYSDKSTKDVTAEAEFTGYDMDSATEQTVTVKYEDKTTSYTINVSAASSTEDYEAVATFDDGASLVFGQGAFDHRWSGESGADTMTNTSADGLGIDGSNAFGINYARSGGWGGVQTATTPESLDWNKVDYVSFYARIVPTSDTSEINFTMRVNGVNYNCSFDATPSWQFFTYDLSEQDLSSMPDNQQIQWTINTKGTGKLVIDNLAFSSYQISEDTDYVKSISVSEPKTEYEVNDEFVVPTVNATYGNGEQEEVQDAVISGYDMASQGKQTVTVTYMGLTVSYEILVGEPVANSNVRNGSNSLKVVVDTSTYDYHCKYNVEIEPDTDYILSVWSKGSGSVNIVGRLNASWSGSDGKTLTLKAGDVWQHNALTFNSGSTANGEEISKISVDVVTVGMGSHGTMYLDDIFLAKVSDPTVNLIADPGFENGTWGTDSKVTFETSDVAAVNNLINIAAINPQTEYTVGDDFVEPTVKAIYADGTEAEVQAAFADYDLSTEGAQTVKVTYENAVTVYPISVKASGVTTPELESIAVSGQQTEYTVGDEFVKPVVTATYSDESTKDVTADSVFSGYDMSAEGKQTVTVEYEGKTTTYEITVSAAASVEPEDPADGLEVVEKYFQLDFEDAAYQKDGDGADVLTVIETTNKITGNKVAINFGNGKYKIVEENGNKYISPNARKTQTSYDIALEEPVSDSANLVYADIKIKRASYNVDDPVTLVFTDDSGNPIFRLHYVQNQAPTLTADQTYSEVTYPINGEWTYVRAIINFRTKTFELYQGTGVSNLVPMVEGTTTFGFEDSTAANLARITNKGIGTAKGSLGFDDVYVFTVKGEEIPVTLESIAVSGAKTEYTVGDEFVKPTVTATYSDDSTKDVTAEAEFTGYNMEEAGPQTVTVTYEDKTTTYEITVSPAAPNYEAAVNTDNTLGVENAVYVTSFVLDEGNGTVKVMIGEDELYWSAERECYVGIVAASNYTQDGTLTNVTTSNEAPAEITYGDNTDDDRINMSDIAAMMNYIEYEQDLVVKLAADVELDGQLNANDLAKLKNYIELGTPFFAE